MKLESLRLFCKQQLVRVGQGLCLSTLMFFAIPTTLVKAEIREDLNGQLGLSSIDNSKHIAEQSQRVFFLAQVSPDESLSTSVEQQGENELNINGGEREGNNLFHSFEDFSVY